MIKELRTRYLMPFFVDKVNLDKMTEALKALNVAGMDKCWEEADAHEFYKDDLLPSVSEYLFQAGSVRYFGLTRVLEDKLFDDAVVRIHEKDVALKLSRPGGVELFITEDGACVLSVSLCCEAVDLEYVDIQELNYRMHQDLSHQNVDIRLLHPMDDTERWWDIPEEDRNKIPKAPEPGAPLSEQLARPGGVFTLKSLMELLVSPLDSFGLNPTQKGKTIYVCLRLDETMDLQNKQSMEVVGTMLASLVKIEEPNHAGSVYEHSLERNAILNRKHISGVGHIGVVHIVGDQSPNQRGSVAYNEERLPRVMVKYFIPYLIALLQRVALHRIVKIAGAIVRNSSKKGGREMMDREVSLLRDQVLRFSVSGNFTQVSTRDALHRFYEISRQGLDVEEASQNVLSTLRELDAKAASRNLKISAERQLEFVENMVKNLEIQNKLSENMDENLKVQAELADSMSKNLKVMAGVQNHVQWIEIFLVSVYAAHLYHMSVEHYEKTQPWLLDWWMVVATAVFAGGVAAYFIRPWKKTI